MIRVIVPEDLNLVTRLSGSTGQNVLMIKIFSKVLVVRKVGGLDVVQSSKFLRIFNTWFHR